jgi:hypothetical protein
MGDMFAYELSLPDVAGFQRMRTMKFVLTWQVVYLPTLWYSLCISFMLS